MENRPQQTARRSAKKKPEDAKPTPHQKPLFDDLRLVNKIEAAEFRKRKDARTLTSTFIVESFVQHALEWIAACEQDFLDRPQYHQAELVCRDIEKQVIQFGELAVRAVVRFTGERSRAAFYSLVSERVLLAKERIKRISGDHEEKEGSLAAKREREREKWMQSRHPGWTTYRWAKHTGKAANTIALYRKGKITRSTKSTRAALAKSEQIEVTEVPA
jgi:hypothetical protein